MLVRGFVMNRTSYNATTMKFLVNSGCSVIYSSLEQKHFFSVSVFPCLIIALLEQFGLKIPNVRRWNINGSPLCKVRNSIVPCS